MPSLAQASTLENVSPDPHPLFPPSPFPDVARAETCGTLYVTGPTAGVYYQNGDYGGKGDYFSGNNAWNMYWTFYAGKPVNRNRFRRGLSIPDERRGGDAGWSEEYGEPSTIARSGRFLPWYGMVAAEKSVKCRIVVFYLLKCRICVLEDSATRQICPHQSHE